MRQLDKIQMELADRDTFILIPKALVNTPIPFKRMQKDDEDGNLIEEYYSVQDLSDAFGNQYLIQEYVDENHVLISWSSYANGEIEAIKDFLTQNGLTNIRDDGSSFGLSVDDIDWANIP
ncbi:MAG: hypothetical protein IE920_11045, partial [Thiotrichales bacterium]|nr:hypothetical protein [Thiotrichales bacterium]